MKKQKAVSLLMVLSAFGLAGCTGGETSSTESDTVSENQPIVSEATQSSESKEPTPISSEISLSTETPTPSSEETSSSSVTSSSSIEIVPDPDIPEYNLPERESVASNEDSSITNEDEQKEATPFNFFYSYDSELGGYTVTKPIVGGSDGNGHTYQYGYYAPYTSYKGEVQNGDILFPEIVEVPATYNDGTNGEHQVLGIDSMAFMSSAFKEVRLPDCMTKIEDKTFTASSLEKIRLPKSLTYIGSRAFANTYVTEYYLPASITTIRDNVFGGKVKINGKYTSVSCHVYAEPQSRPSGWDSGMAATGTTVSYGVLGYGETKQHFNYAITGTKANYVGTILGYVGQKSTITLPSAIDGYNISKVANEAFYSYSSLIKVNIPTGYVEIGEKAFDLCKNLSVINLPDTVTTIGDYAFASTALEYFYFPVNASIKLGRGTLYHCNSLQAPVIPDTYTSLGAGTFNSCEALKTVKLPSHLTKIDENCFSSAGIETLSMPATLTTIEKYAFFGCQKIVKMVLPNTITTVGESAFSYCTQGVLYCEAESRPEGWNEGFSTESSIKVVWGYHAN